MKRIFWRPAAIAVAAIGLAGCTAYDDYGYGYSGVSLGYGSGYSSPYYGWYDDYYYPGVGYYIYDRRGIRYRWSDRHRSYWEARRPSRGYRENWSGYRRDRDGWDRNSRRDRDGWDRNRGRDRNGWNRNRGRGDDRGDRRRGRDRDDDRRGRGRGRDD